MLKYHSRAECGRSRAHLKSDIPTRCLPHQNQRQRKSSQPGRTARKTVGAAATILNMVTILIPESEPKAARKTAPKPKTAPKLTKLAVKLWF